MREEDNMLPIESNPFQVTIPEERLDKILTSYQQFKPPALIANPAERAVVYQELVAVVSQKKWAITQLDEILSPIKALEAKIRSEFKPCIGVLENVEKQLRNRVNLYDNEENARLEAQRRKEQEEANRIAREKHLAQLAEVERLKKEAEIIANSNKEKLLEEAFEAELSGEGVKAEALKLEAQAIEAPVVVEPEVVEAPIIPSIQMKYRDGSTPRAVRKWRVLDRAKIPAEFWLLDEKKIAAMCRAKLKAPEGIEFYQEVGVAVRLNSF